MTVKWNKFLEMQRQYPSLAHNINWRGIVQDPHDFVRTKLEYVAFRTFEKLDLATTKSSSSSTPLPSPYQHVRFESFVLVEFKLVFHTEYEPNGSRERLVYDDVGNGSIQAHIDEIAAWHASCQAFRGQQLVWECIVKRTVSGSTHVGISNMRLEIYRFPKHYRFKAMPRQQLPPANEATIAYMTGGHMPPIIPGTLSFA